MTPQQSKHFYEFGSLRLDPAKRVLLREGMPLALTAKVFDTLLVLVERRGQVVEKDELMKLLWPDSFVEEANLSQNVSILRKVLGESPNDHRYIVTVPGRGYRFVAEVTESGDEESDLIVKERTRSRIVVTQEGNVDQASEEEKVLLATRDKLSIPGESSAAMGGSSRRRVLFLSRKAIALAALLTMVLGGVLLSIWLLRGRTLAHQLEIKSIAVLPLENLSRDPDQEFFADGMTEELITSLGKISALRVISRTSVMRYKGTKKPLPEIGRELNVDALVEGTVQRSGDRVRITANLLHAPSDRHLWAETYERDLRDVLALQGEVARDIASEIRIHVTPQEQIRLANAQPVNPEAYRLYLQGRYQWSKRTPAANEKSITLFQQALEKDPASALAWAGLAESYGTVAVHYSTSPKEWFAKAKAAVLKALEIDNSIAEAHTALGYIHYRWDWDWSGAERELKNGVELKPSDSYALYRYSDYLSLMGRHEEAIAEIRRAQQLDPVSSLMLVQAAVVYKWAHRYDEAIEESRNALELDPNLGVAHHVLGLTYTAKGMAKEAAAEYETGDRLGRGHGLDIDSLVYAAAGRRGEARKLLLRVKEQAKRGEMTPFAVAQFYVGLGEKERALDWLEKAYDQHDPFMTTLKVNVFFDPLRSDPRFQDLLRRMNFPP